MLIVATEEWTTRKTTKSPGEKIVKDIRRATRKHYSSEEKIRIVLDGLRGNPFDGHTLGEALKQTTALTGGTPKRAHVDKGYRGHKQKLKTPDPASGLPTRPSWQVFISGRKALKPSLKAELKRRSAIEPVIGHMKADHRMGKNHLKGRSGDRFNVKMAAIGFNFRRILKWLEALVLWLTVWMWANTAGLRKMAVC